MPPLAVPGPSEPELSVPSPSPADDHSVSSSAMEVVRKSAAGEPEPVVCITADGMEAKAEMGIFVTEEERLSRQAKVEATKIAPAPLRD